ncbi:MAG: polyprenyl diphosphate synthase [Candidatus Izemoplasmatales bacterium]|jgi:undecaprenyl diphosphate synthase|nr:polyprenyl diphosphate synthase [Candidatus Izemoplasmatales bacterium]MDD4595153.1 polyprenyl diphosphate synthase [Candidatus Izemoplasmatales bacterium]
MISKKMPETIIIPEHVAIILDGNGRWAKKRGMPRTFGHQAGVENIRRIAIASQNIGIKALSVFAFSTENWNRPQGEIDYLMTLPKEFETKFHDDFQKNDIKVIFSGRKTKLSEVNIAIMERITTESKDRQGLILNICFDYGSYDELTEAVKAIAYNVRNGDLDPETITPDVIASHLLTRNLPPLDFLIRTSGEQRLSNFMLWQAAYAELYFTPTYWPDFSPKELMKAIKDFSLRDRRFGAIKR